MERISKQLVLSTQSGLLKPDVRLGVAVSEFAQTLDEDRKREFQKMQSAGTQLSGRDAICLTEELNQDSERRHCTWRPYGTKCGKFLDRLQALATIGDVMIGGSQNVIATSIWCAVRLALQTATNFRGYFERLSSLFLKLGTSWELHHEFAQIFPQSEVLQTFLCEYLIVLMRLCRKTVIFSQKSLTGQLWSSLGASFDYEFKPLQEEMDKWGTMIQHKTQQLAAACVVDADKFRRRDYKQRVLHLLSPNQSQHVTTWRRHRRKGDCKWIYQSAAYKSWTAEDASSTICVSGKLGSGKTVTMANIVAEISMHLPCAFFFCTFKEPESLKATTVLGSIAFHLLDNIPGNKATWDILSKQEETASLLFTSIGIINIMTDLLPEDKKYVVVLDGLEDCPNDEMIEVMSGLRRFMAQRSVLLCYAARSGSMFQRLTVQELTTKFFLSLDEQMHHKEIEAYITEEIARRRSKSHPGLLSDELEQLVKKQLMAGAQGMYLWVALQLDSIFPNQSRTVVTSERILNLINNLPKDLPEAFERALEEIVDDRYGNSILKIVMAARLPLTLDELTVALTVHPGDPVWYAAEVPTDGPQLIALCGGNLLDLDEEDGRVRFIHYSVVNHLLQTTKNLRTILYHFSIQEAEILAGAICVTFLNMAIFKTDVTMTKKITAEKLVERAIGAASHQQPFLSHIAQHFKKSRYQSTPTNFDIGRLIAEIQAAGMAKFDPRCFQFFEKSSPVCMKIWPHWTRLLCGEVPVASTPFQSPMEEPWPALCWALMNHHNPLFHTILENPTTEPRNSEILSLGIISLTSSSEETYDRFCLGLLLAHSIQLAIDFLFHGSNNEESSSTSGNIITPSSIWPWQLLYQALEKLLDLGADTAAPHPRNGDNIAKMLLTTLGRISKTTMEGAQLRDLLDRVLATSRPFRNLLYRPMVSLPAHKYSLMGVAVARGNAEEVRDLFKGWPDHRLPSCVHGREAIHLALETQNYDILVLLAQYKGLDRPDKDRRSSVPLLETALERMTAGWVKNLLQLGADRNLGYSARETGPGKFLILVRYHADTSLPAFPNISNIVAHRGNRVLMAKLKEKESFEPSEAFLERAGDDVHVNALLEACQMLAEDMGEDQTFEDFGLGESFDTRIFDMPEELKLIILELVETTPSAWLDAHCPKGNTALHYLTGSMKIFHRQALDVASHLMTVEWIDSWVSFINEEGQTPLHYAIENGYLNGWSLPYFDSICFLIADVRPEVGSIGSLSGGDRNLLEFAIWRLAPVEAVIIPLLSAGIDPDATLNGATPLETTVNIQSFEYASIVTVCLLSRCADLSVKRSDEGKLLDIVLADRRQWLQSMLSKYSF
ncbi:hypothetical protein N8I77_011954 [Diaporthe amygdali]|uniref:Nephrocystin 3-like N-terminal domain-containing protein n=1 Tax=Phomopsis amygdali TaxID=1214568 RepID=A0AAD9S3Q9_PHOAM|nr:hypothetical protein N8I77_011954 [Diaporthe amygdali]